MSDNLLPRIPDWVKGDLGLTPEQMKHVRNPRFLSEVVKPTPVDRAHDVPYVAGVSGAGKKVYIDRHLRPTYKGHSIVPFLMVHERSEWVLMHLLGLQYQAAHKIATALEKKAIEEGGTMSWKLYQDHYKKYIKHADKEKLVNPPEDLDLVPYQDEHDYKHIKQLMRNGKP